MGARASGSTEQRPLRAHPPEVTRTDSRLASTTDAQSNKTSACLEAGGASQLIDAQVQLGRNTVSIYPALKDRRFESIEEQNTWLAHWEERWSAPRIRGRKMRQILEMFAEEKPQLQPLPIAGMRYFDQLVRTVDDAGTVHFGRSFCAAGRAPLYGAVLMRAYSNEIEILDFEGRALRRHQKINTRRPLRNPGGRPDLQPLTQNRLLAQQSAQDRATQRRVAQQLFNRRGRPGQKALYGLTNLGRAVSQGSRALGRAARLQSLVSGGPGAVRGYPSRALARRNQKISLAVASRRSAHHR
jgi:hypothetical protein